MIILENLIRLKRVYLRRLKPIDMNDEYLSWFGDTMVKEFIEFAQNTINIEDLVLYLNEQNASNTTLFLGIFTLTDDLHIGNVKFELIGSSYQYADMGILIGNNSWRGKGIAPEVILGAGLWLRNNLSIDIMTLEVFIHHEKAMKSYKKMGFKVIDSAGKDIPKNARIMSLDLAEVDLMYKKC